MLSRCFGVFRVAAFERERSPFVDVISSGYISARAGDSAETFRPEREKLEQRYGFTYIPARRIPYFSRLKSLTATFVWIYQLAVLVFFARTTMMFTSFNAECDSSSRCSASPSGDNHYYPSPAGSYSSMGSPQSQVRLLQGCLIVHMTLDCRVKFQPLCLFDVPFGESGQRDEANLTLFKPEPKKHKFFLVIQFNQIFPNNALTSLHLQ